MSVETPVANKPLEATANDPPKSTKKDIRIIRQELLLGINIPIEAIVPPWRIWSRF